MELESKISDEQIKADILHKLYRKRKWAGSHTAFENLYKWCDQRYAERYKNLAKDLIKEGFLLPKPTAYGLQISLTPDKREEIIAIIHRFFNSSNL